MDFEIKMTCNSCSEISYVDLDLISQDMKCPHCNESPLVHEVDEPDDDPMWADSDALASAGFGTDEDYGAGELL